MQHNEVKQLLPLYLEGELEPEEAELVKRFLAQYPDLQKEAHSLQRAWNMLGEAEEIQPREGYVSRFWTTLATRQSEHGHILGYLKGMILGRKTVPALAATCVIVLTVIAGMKYLNPSQDVYQEMAAMSAEELEIAEDIELIDNFELIAELDTLEDFDVIKSMDIGDV